MSTVIHFIDVGQGNMVLMEATDGKYYLCDCNVTNDNEEKVLSYMASVIGWYTPITAFICTHRDADHMRGIKKIHDYFPIQSIWDSDHPGTTTTSSEYKDYMDLRRRVGNRVKKKKTREDLGMTRLRYLSAKDERLEKNANAQGLVIKVEHWNSSNCGSSVILTGDCDAETWKSAIMQDYNEADVKASILMGAHHGSISFFDDPADDKYYYIGHIKAINPDMTIISVGDNAHGHPDSEAIDLYERYTQGSKQGNKVFTTQDKGTLKLTLKDQGWSLNVV
ncbi:ComEC/Rec2 family competence protein [Neptuniibacter sp. QD37_11]|uniref:ComEC/Rec2 family competence protein n=1 Tax=Neptuniibacter sp. QD37_11 TaxID=3398209 RepID=UPI0039F4A14F